MLENKQQKTFSKKPSCFKGVIRNLNGHFRYPTNQKAVEKNDICEFYLSRISTKKTVTVEYIDEVLKDIEELEWIYRDYNY